MVLWAEVSLTTPFALGTKSAAKAGLQGQEHVRLPAPHAHSMLLAHTQEPRQSSTQMPPLFLTTASKGLSHGHLLSSGPQGSAGAVGPLELAPSMPW